LVVTAVPVSVRVAVTRNLLYGVPGTRSIHPLISNGTRPARFFLCGRLGLSWSVIKDFPVARGALFFEARASIVTMLLVIFDGATQPGISILHLWLDQIIPTVPHSQPEVTICRNPLPSAFGQHFYLALADPIHDAELVREAGMIAGLKATKFEIRDEGRKIVLTLSSPPRWTLRTGAVLAFVL